MPDETPMMVALPRFTRAMKIASIFVGGMWLLTLVLHCWTKIKPARLAIRMAMLERHVASTHQLLTTGAAAG